MPVTAKLSRKFYETFGDEIANELVEWFNQVDATYRSDLRELNELNFQRFDAKLEQRVAELRADFDRRFAQSDAKLEKQVAQLRADVDRRFAQSDAKLEHIDRLLTELDRRFTESDGTMARHVGQLRQEMAGMRAELMKWMFVFWSGTLIPLGGLVVALITLR